MVRDFSEAPCFNIRVKKWIFLLRSFFPKWIFFDDVAPELRLEVSFGKNSASAEWVNALTPVRRSLKNLIVNAGGNYLHAHYRLPDAE
jgi:hypothetical protein